MTPRFLADLPRLRDRYREHILNHVRPFGAKIISRGRYVAFQTAEVAIPRQLFAGILRLIAELRPRPDPTPA